MSYNSARRAPTQQLRFSPPYLEPMNTLLDTDKTIDWFFAMEGSRSQAEGLQEGWIYRSQEEFYQSL